MTMNHVRERSGFWYSSLMCMAVVLLLIGCGGSGGGDAPTGSGGAGIILSESLKNNTTSGEVKDGAFTGQGIQFSGDEWHLKYRIPTVSNGYLEFRAKGFVPQELHDGAEFQGYLVTMWDGAYAFDHATNPFIFELFKFGYIPGRPDATDALFLGVTSQGRFMDSYHHGFYVLDWNPEMTYHFRIEWGGGEGRVYRNGEYIGGVEYYGEFRPSEHLIQIGANLNNPIPGLRKEGPRGLLISDVIVGSS